LKGDDLLQDGSSRTREKLMEAVERGKSQVVGIKRTIVVHAQYWTAWLDKTGKLNFRHDIYDRDKPLDRALKEQRHEA